MFILIDICYGAIPRKVFADHGNVRMQRKREDWGSTRAMLIANLANQLFLSCVSVSIALFVVSLDLCASGLMHDSHEFLLSLRALGASFTGLWRYSRGHRPISFGPLARRMPRALAIATLFPSKDVFFFCLVLWPVST